MEILGGYGIGYNLQRLLHCYWEEQAVVSKAIFFCAAVRDRDRGNQGDPVSLKILNTVSYVEAREVLLKVFRPQEAHHGLVWVADEHNTILYAENGRIAGSNPTWVQTTLAAVARMFKGVVLIPNLGKTKLMVRTPGFIWGKQGKS